MLRFRQSVDNKDNTGLLCNVDNNIFFFCFLNSRFRYFFLQQIWKQQSTEKITNDLLYHCVKNVAVGRNIYRKQTYTDNFRVSYATNSVNMNHKGSNHATHKLIKLILPQISLLLRFCNIAMPQPGIRTIPPTTSFTILNNCHWRKWLHWSWLHR